MALGRNAFLAIAILFHGVYIYSIFDIYFVSPLVHGMTAHRVGWSSPPADRLVLFVGDGLRADKTFQFFPNPNPPTDIDSDDSQDAISMAPFLRSRVTEEGTFGVSHTRVPTESRPGHVALIAGLYEDVAAVTTGWKLNPVEFDSIFNRSRHTWSWGSPDILPMFSIGASPGRVEDCMYDAAFEDYSKDATELDYWVFDHVKALFKTAGHDSQLRDKLSQNRIVFFLHLLGIDTTGHTFRPYSQEYLRNIQVVDQGVQEISTIMQEYYGDDRTAYIFTADHGMSDWGSHGDGHPDNTRTPLIAWGSGIARPQTQIGPGGKASGHDDGFSADWQLDHIARHDVDQADIATLMAYLLDLELPVNSVGRLPLAFLNATAEQKARALYTNAKQISEMYRLKEQQKMTEVIQYKPYKDFSRREVDSVEHRLESIETLLSNHEYDLAIQKSAELIDVSIEGLRYLQTYAWFFLRTLVTLGYLGWIAFTFTETMDISKPDMISIDRRRPGYGICFASILIGLCSFLFIQKSPLTYYAYTAFPIFFWERALPPLIMRFRSQTNAWAVMWQENHSLVVQVATYVFLLELLVQSYYYRVVYTFAYCALALWPLAYGIDFVKLNKAMVIIWFIVCTAMSVFTLLPARKMESLTLVSLGGILILCVGGVCLAIDTAILTPLVPTRLRRYIASDNDPSRFIFFLQVVLVGACLLVTRSAVTSLSLKQGLPAKTQIAGWSIFVTSLMLPIAYVFRPIRSYVRRYATVFLALGPTFIVLTISYEGLFYLAISATLFTWVELECIMKLHSESIRPTADYSEGKSTANATSASYPRRLNDSAHISKISRSEAKTEKSTRDSMVRKTLSASRSLQMSDLRICIFFLFFLHSAFFSTGNIASISSFSLDAVYRLLPVFDPFSQAALLLFKIFAPFILVSANLGFLTRRLQLRRGSLFVAVTGLSEYLTLRFFWAVKDEGSWLEIGETISMFVISSALCVFVAGLEALSEVLVDGIELDS